VRSSAGRVRGPILVRVGEPALATGQPGGARPTRGIESGITRGGSCSGSQRYREKSVQPRARSRSSSSTAWPLSCRGRGGDQLERRVDDDLRPAPQLLVADAEVHGRLALDQGHRPQRVDGDVVRAQLLGEAVSEHRHAVLADQVADLVGQRAQLDRGRADHDVPATDRAHRGDHRLRGGEGGPDVDLVHQVEARQRRVGDVLPPQRAGVVHEDVDAAELLLGPGDHRVDVLDVADIDAEREHLPAERLDLARDAVDRSGQARLLGLALGRDHHAGALAREGEGHDPADATAGSGDDRDLPGETLRRLHTAG
jgi:hypothetical protein